MKESLYKFFGIFLIMSSLTLAIGSFSVAIAPPVLADTVSDIQGGVDGSGGGGDKNKADRVPTIIRTVVNVLLFIIGVFAVIMIVIAGLRFVTSNGDANTLSSAKNTIIYALVGLAVAVIDYAIVNFVVGQLT